ncbi:ABC transporter substrate-binding protein [Flavisphingomonas formosensis]|uniref:ABC transporter substrate-binding protein n=1 Tax=Flavisphingomonas formosensis TaxID=861534 RepID=UPI0012F9237A|nr:ABC transporter substrate-binding protein [Sphingomonas formosensis]
MAFLVLLGVIACPHAEAHARDTLTVALQLEPPNLDPTSGAAVAVDEVTYGTVFETLVRLDAQGTVKPWLAQRWTASSDGLIYSFTLRPDVRFHDGAPFTARDAAFSLMRAIAPGSTNAQAGALSVIARAEAVAPLILRVTLKRPDADFLRLLSYGDAAMVSPRSASALASAPIGTGPFRFSAWRRGEAITLARNDAYWGAHARLARIVFRFIADPSAAFAAIKAHDVDIFKDFPAPETLAQLQADPTIKLAIGPTEGQVILAFNQRSGPLADLRVRQAISHALDRRAIIDGAMFGYGTPIGSHFAPQDPDYVDLTGRYPHDPAAARRLLAAAGYGHGLDLTLKLPPAAYARRSGEIVAAQLASVGIRVDIRNLEWASWLDEVYKRHAFDLTIVNHAEPYDYDIYGRDDYYFGYRSAAVHALLDRLKTTADPAARHGLLVALQQRLADDAANGFLFEYPGLGVQDASLRDIWINTPNEALDFAGANFGDRQGGSGSERLADAPASLGGWILLALALVALVALVALGRWIGPVALARRIGIVIATLFAATLLIFALVQIAPGDPAAYMMGLDANPQAIAALHAQLGLEGSAHARYLAWIAGLLHGDFGLSYTYRVPVAGLLSERLVVSLPLALFATSLSIAIGIPAGYFAARGQGGVGDRLVLWIARIGIAIPSFWLAVLLVLLFSVGLRWLGSGGFPGWQAGWGAALAALVLPTVALALPQAAILARVMRTSLLETMELDYVRTARAKGLSRNAALARHALPNALGPVVTVLGLQVPFLLAGSAIVETIFFLPGLGRLVLQAIAQRDLIVVQAVALLLVAATILASFLADLALAALDPRLRRSA